jgi:tetratricopeptide (TPR) repeat protein
VENLRQLLQNLPANGEIRFSDNPAVERIMNAGEAAFARRDFDEALAAYAKALELEPTNYSAALFTANTYDRKNDFARASQWYERTTHLNPDIEKAFPLLCRHAGAAGRYGEGAQHAHSRRRSRTL